jgi:predicted MPP superfamily phosphohydrolase
MLRSFMRIQYISDIHLDINESSNFSNLLKPAGDVLILAGDISSPLYHKLPKFLKWCHEHWDKVILVPGNHEYYNTKGKYNMIEVEKTLENICQETGIIFAQKSVISLRSDLHLLACTLWSDINGAEITVRNRMSDFKMIPDMNIEKWKGIYSDHVNWLTENIEKYNGNVVVVTHHAPLLYRTANPFYEGTIGNRAYASDLGYLVKKTKGWIFGHTHHYTDIIYPEDAKPGSGTPVLSNPSGYFHEDTGYKLDKFLEL